MANFRPILKFELVLYNNSTKIKGKNTLKKYKHMINTFSQKLFIFIHI